MDGLTGFAVQLGVLRAHAQLVRTLGEHEWADLAVRLGALGLPGEAFGDAATLARLPDAYTEVREDEADRAARAADTLIAVADTLDRLAARYQGADAEDDRPLHPDTR